MLIRRNNIKWYVPIKGVYEVAFASWVDAPTACFEQDWLGQGLCHFELYLSNQGISHACLDVIFFLWVNEAASPYDRYLCHGGEGRQSLPLGLWLLDVRGGGGSSGICIGGDV
jgi:hypothetical protein